MLTELSCKHLDIHRLKHFFKVRLEAHATLVSTDSRQGNARALLTMLAKVHFDNTDNTDGTNVLLVNSGLFALIALME